MTETSLSERILSSHPTAIIAIDGANRVCYANQAALKFFSTDTKWINGRDVVELFGGDETLAQRIGLARDEKGEVRVRIRVGARKGDSQTDVGLTLSPYYDNVEQVALVLSFRDITERKLLNARGRQLERLSSAERLVGGFAHQLRNPLAAISALVENLVLEMSDDDPRLEYTTRLINQVSHMEHLIRASLQFGAAPPGFRQRTTPESIGRAVIEAFSARCGVSPRLVVEEGIGEVYVCEDQITQCLRLLLDRGYDACGDVSKMELLVSPQSTGGDKHFVRFVVRDEGPGIEKEDLLKIFEPFFTTKAKGVGMGLAAAQNLAVHNGGSLEARSEPGDTQFILRLRTADHAAAEISPDKSGSPTLAQA